MTLRWVIGNFSTGDISESDTLPVISGTDKITLNINSEDFATLKLSKKDLPTPGAWKTYLRPVYKMVAAVDTSKAWDNPNAILFAGFIKEVLPPVGDAITIQVAGFREYASLRIASSGYAGTYSDPTAGKEWTANNHASLMQKIIADIFEYGSQSGPRTPAVKGSTNFTPGNGSISYKALNNELLTYSDILDDIRDVESLKGNEYRFRPRWNTSAKTKIVFDSFVGTESAPLVNFATTVTIDLNNSNNFLFKVSNKLSSRDYSNRILGISKQGDYDDENSEVIEETDYRATTRGGTSEILVDSIFNPGRELTSVDLNAAIIERLNYSSDLTKQDTIEVGVIKNETVDFISNLGARLLFTENGSRWETSGGAAEARLVEIIFSLSSKEIEVGLLGVKGRYGKLPNSPTRPPFGREPNSDRKPIVPKVPSNVPKPKVPSIPEYTPPGFGDDITGDITLSVVTKSIPADSDFNGNYKIQGITGDGRVIFRANADASSVVLPGNHTRNVGIFWGTGVSNNTSLLSDLYPNINFRIDRIDDDGNFVDNHKFVIPSTVLSENLSLSNTHNDGEMRIHLAWSNNSFNISTSNPMIQTYKNLYLFLWSDGNKFYTHFVQANRYQRNNYSEPQNSNLYFESFTYVWDYNPNAENINEVLTNYRKTDTFGYNLLKEKYGEDIAVIPDFKRFVTVKNKNHFVSPVIFKDFKRSWTWNDTSSTTPSGRIFDRFSTSFIKEVQESYIYRDLLNNDPSGHQEQKNGILSSLVINGSGNEITNLVKFTNWENMGSIKYTAPPPWVGGSSSGNPYSLLSTEKGFNSFIRVSTFTTIRDFMVNYTENTGFIYRLLLPSSFSAASFYTVKPSSIEDASKLTTFSSKTGIDWVEHKNETTTQRGAASNIIGQLGWPYKEEAVFIHPGSGSSFRNGGRRYTSGYQTKNAVIPTSIQNAITSQYHIQSGSSDSAGRAYISFSACKYYANDISRTILLMNNSIAIIT